MKIGLAAVLFALAFASCVPQKKMLYLKDAQMAAENISNEYINENLSGYCRDGFGYFVHGRIKSHLPRRAGTHPANSDNGSLW